MTDLAVQGDALAAATVQSAAAGDEAAFARLIADHNAAMARVAYVIVGDRELTLDAVQSAWSIAWRRLGSLREPERVRSWLVAIAANEARQAVRRRRRATVVDISSVIEPAGRDDPGEAIEIVDLKRAIARLAPDERALLTLRFVGRLDSNEIGRQLNISGSGVRSRLARLLDRLRSELDPGEES